MENDIHGEIKFTAPEETMAEIAKVYEMVKHLYLSVASLNHQLELLKGNIPMVVYRINELKDTIK